MTMVQAIRVHEFGGPDILRCKAIALGALKVHIGGRYPLAQAAQAHRDLKARATMGALSLVPSAVCAMGDPLPQDGWG